VELNAPPMTTFTDDGHGGAPWAVLTQQQQRRARSGQPARAWSATTLPHDTVAVCVGELAQLTEASAALSVDLVVDVLVRRVRSSANAVRR